ncbi:helix-turn-helix transcriptional regulator [Actinoplanes sp. NPDC023936]|uniref:helix-turn-helix domain-containing protein n=1 Tax=Actinoplanes sp. NPDC023936 TaxID=3154910 RepID=UPI0033D5437F
MTSTEGRAAGELLRSRRELLTPDAVGLPRAGRRRVPGLRRDEVAMLAGISPGYYARLERGEAARPAPHVLDAVAHALRLDEQATAQLYRYARPRARPRRPAGAAEPVHAGLRRLIEQVGSLPAFVLGRTQDVLTWNALAAALFSGFSRHDNMVRMLFLDPATDTFYRDPARARRRAVADLQRVAAEAPHDRRVRDLVGELAVCRASFRALWARTDLAAVPVGGIEQIQHRGVGALELHREAFTVRGMADQQLVILHPEPGSASADALVLLRAMAGEPDR